MKLKTIFVLWVVLVAATFVLAQGTQPGPCPHKMGNQGSMDCKAMMEKMQQRKTDMDAMDAKLDQLITRMNSASGEEKVQAMEAVINELVAQRKSMHGSMMPSGCCGGDCPMMKQ